MELLVTHRDELSITIQTALHWSVPFIPRCRQSHVIRDSLAITRLTICWLGQ